MNSGFRPLPKTMPFWERVNIMIRRGEAKSPSEAVRLLRPPKAVKSPVMTSNPPLMRLPYADN